MTFSFVSRRLFFLSKVPLLPVLYDSMLKFWTLIFNHRIIDMIDEIENEIGSLKNITVGNHRFGGIEFRLNGRELGHIHGHGLADIYVSSKMKQTLMTDPDIHEHHKHKNSNWISIHVRDDKTKRKVIDIFRTLASEQFI